MSEGSGSVHRTESVPDFGTRYLEKPLFKYNGGGIKQNRRGFFSDIRKSKWKEKVKAVCKLDFQIVSLSPAHGLLE